MNQKASHYSFLLFFFLDTLDFSFLIFGWAHFLSRVWKEAKRRVSLCDSDRVELMRNTFNTNSRSLRWWLLFYCTQALPWHLLWLTNVDLLLVIITLLPAGWPSEELKVFQTMNHTTTLSSYQFSGFDKSSKHHLASTASGWILKNAMSNTF